jgi:hypothetical protein
MMLRNLRASPADRAVTGCNRKGGITQGSAVDFGTELLLSGKRWLETLAAAS